MYSVRAVEIRSFKGGIHPTIQVPDMPEPKCCRTEPTALNVDLT